MRTQYPLQNLRTGETTGRLTLFTADAAAGTVTLGDVPADMRAAVKRGENVSLLPAENVPADECSLPEHVVVDDDMTGIDDLSDLFDDDDVTDTVGRLARSVVAENVRRPSQATVSLGSENETHIVSFSPVKATSTGAPRYRASVAIPFYGSNGRAWTVHIGATWTETSKATTDSLGESVPATGTLRFRPRVVNV